MHLLRPDVLRAVSYNGPIAVLFLTVAAYLATRTLQLGIRRFLVVHSADVVLWAIGLALLYLRLGRRSIEVSGHLAWLPLLTAQAWVHGLPRAVVAMGLGGLAVAGYLKFVVFRGPSGVPGALVGAILAGAFFLSCWRRQPVS